MPKSVPQLLRKSLSSLLFHLPVIVLGMFLAAWFTFPAITQLRTHFIGDGGDNYQYAGFQYLVATNIDSGKWPYAALQSWYYPNGFEFARGYDSVLSTLGGGLLVLLTRDLAYSYNLSILFSFLFNFLAAYALYWNLSRSRMWASVGAVLFGFSFYALARAGGHANLLLIGGFPLFLLSLLQLLRKQEWRAVLLLGLASILLVFSSLQYALMAVASLLIGIPLVALVYPEAMGAVLFKKIPAAFLQLAVVGLFVCVVAAPFVWPFIHAYQAQDFYQRGEFDFSPRMVDLLLPNPYFPVPLSSLLPVVPGTVGIEQTIALGPVFFVLIVFLLWRFRRQHVVGLAGLVLTVFGILALGTRNPETGIILPYHLLSSVFPFSAIPEAGRFVVVMNVVGGALIASYGKKIFRGRAARVSLGMFVLVLLILERSSWGKFFQLPVPSLGLAQAVQAQPGAAVLELPLFEQRQSVSPVYFHKATLTGEPHWLAHTPQAMAFLQGNPALAGLTCFDRTHLTGTVPGQGLSISTEERAAFFKYLKTAGVQTVVIRRDGTLYWDMCRETLARIDQLFPQYLTAEITAQGAQSETQMFWSGEAFTGGLYFPSSGALTIHGFSYMPYDEQPELRIDGQQVSAEQWSYEVSTHESGERMVFVRTGAAGERHQVSAGATLETTIAKTPQHRGVLTLWYTYEPVGAEELQLQDGVVTKVYEESAVEVWRIE